MEKRQQIGTKQKAADRTQGQDDNHRKANRWKKKPIVIRYGKI